MNFRARRWDHDRQFSNSHLSYTSRSWTALLQEPQDFGNISVIISTLAVNPTWAIAVRGQWMNHYCNAP